MLLPEEKIEVWVEAVCFSLSLDSNRISLVCEEQESAEGTVEAENITNLVPSVWLAPPGRNGHARSLPPRSLPCRVRITLETLHISPSHTQVAH